MLFNNAPFANFRSFRNDITFTCKVLDHGHLVTLFFDQGDKGQLSWFEDLHAREFFVRVDNFIHITGFLRRCLFGNEGDKRIGPVFKDIFKRLLF